MGWAGVILGDLIEVRWDSESYSHSQVMLARVSFFLEFKQKSSIYASIALKIDFFVDG